MAPTMTMAEIALVTAISGVCSAGVTVHHVVAHVDGQHEDDEVDDGVKRFHARGSESRRPLRHAAGRDDVVIQGT